MTSHAKSRESDERTTCTSIVPQLSTQLYLGNARGRRECRDNESTLTDIIGTPRQVTSAAGLHLKL